MIEKAINELEDYVAENDKLTISFETVTLARKALEKQTPKKLEVWADGTEHCPNCEHDNSCLGFKVCVSCGQRLDN